MRNLFALLLLLPGAALSFLGCSDDLDETGALNPVFSVDAPSLTFEWAGGTQNVNVTFEDINGSWFATTSDEWITLADNSGSESGRFSATAGANTTGGLLSGMITVKAPGQADITIPVEQPYDDTPVFETDKSSLEFTADGGSDTFILTFVNIEGDWEIAPTEDWLQVTPFEGSETAEITVAVDPYEFTADRSFTVVISSEGYENIEIEISQEGFVPPAEPTNINEQSIQARLNFTKAVYKVSRLYDPLSKTEIQNLEFNKNGMLVKFDRTDMHGTEFCELGYDEQIPHRLRTISSDRGGEGLQVEVEFAYGDHGKWIGTKELFLQLDNQGAGAIWKIWAPGFIKNLEKVIFHKSLYGESDGAIFEYAISGNAGVLRYVDPNQANDPEDFQTLTFEGDYLKQVDFPFSLMGPEAPFIGEYDINASTGAFNSYMMYAEAMGMKQSVYTYIYGDDRLNTRTAVYDIFNSYVASDYMSAVGVQYDDKLNVVKIDTPTSHNFSYVYDEYGNWIKMDMSGGSTQATVERTIEYR